jgi:hypothetical protein
MGPSPPPPSPPPKKSKWGIVWRIITGIILLMGAYWTATQIKNYHKSPEQKYEEATITPGDLKPPKFNPSANTWFYTLEKKPVFTTYPSSNKKLPAVKGILLKDTDSSTIVAFSVGVSVAIVPLKLLYQGIVLNVLSRGNCDTVKLIFGVKDDRLYTSCEFKNLATEETAGIIEFNHWRLFKEHYLYCSNDDSTLEVRDNQNYVNFSLKYELGNKNFNQVFIGGYFIKPTSISVFTNFWKGAARVQDTCYNKLDKSWKQKAEINISALVSVYE